MSKMANKTRKKITMSTTKTVTSKRNNKKQLSLEEGWQLFCKRNQLKQLSKDTHRNYEEKVYRKFMNWLESEKIEYIQELTLEVIEDYILYLQSTSISTNSINSYVRAVRTFVYHMMEKGYINNYKITLLKKEEKVLNIYTDEDIKKLTTRPKDATFAQFRNYVVSCILASTGIRVTSLVEILNKDVDLDNGLITLRHTKNKRLQIIYLSTTLIKIISEYMEIVNGESDDTLIVTYLGQPMSRTSLNHEIVKYARGMGIDVEKHCHGFRYWYGLSLAKQDVGAFTIMNLMGHKNVRTSQGYIERAGFDVKDRINSINPLEKLNNNNINKKKIIKTSNR